MWGTVLVLALIAVVEPVRLGTAVFLISGPRPIVNVFAFWLGGITMCVAVAASVLALFRDFGLTVVHGLATMAASSTARHVQVAVGVLAVLTAAVILGSSVRQRTYAATGGANPPAPVQQSSTPKVFSRLSASTTNALESGFPWVAFVAGLWLSVPPVEYAVTLGSILASGAAAGTQISAVVVFAVVAFVFFEIPLVGYLASPAKTRAMMLQLHNWVRGRRRQILAAIVGAAGALLVVTGVGIL